jgi:long-subunit fatty acid transport protein
MQKKHLLVAAGILTVSAPAFSAGFEKSSFWSGQYAGIAGAAASSAQGAEALYWNPAGLVEDGHQGFEVSGNITPTMAKFEGPFYASTSSTSPSEVSGNTKWVPPFGAFLSYGVTKDWSVGIGIYTGAGTSAEFDDVLLNPALPAVTMKSSLYVLEYSLGTSYQILPGLKIGAAWRIVHGSADLAGGQVVGGTNLLTYDLEGLSQTRLNGWRAGIEYESDAKNWGLGATWRSAVDFTNATTTNATVAENGTSLGGSSASAALNFPTQLSVAGHYDILPQTLRGFAQYTWTQFHNNPALSNGSGIVLNTVAGSSGIPLNWNNENTLRFGFECSAVQDWKFRVGYSWGNQVQPDDTALPILVAPGVGQTFALGAGTSIFNHMLDLNAALQYDVASGSVTNNDYGLNGSYKSYDLALNLGATYRF